MKLVIAKKEKLSRSPRNAARHTFRPGLEQLESREVPA